MLTETKPLKRGTKPHGFVDMKVAVTPELNAMLDHVCLTTGISKAALVRDALTRYGEALGFLPEGSIEHQTPTRTRGPGLAAERRD